MSEFQAYPVEPQYVGLASGTARPLRVPAAIAVVALVVAAVVGVADAALGIAGFDALATAMATGDHLSHAEAQSVSGAVRLLLLQAASGLAALLFAGVSFICWLRRARMNLIAVGAPPLRWGPGWTIGGWFVPLANLVIPLLVVHEIDAASQAMAPATPRKARALRRALFGLWAVTWTLYLIVDRVEGLMSTLLLRAAVQGDSGARDVQVNLAVGAAALTVTAVGFAVALVLRVTANQQRTMSAPPPPPVPADSGLQPSFG
jgi:hypothetical protein